MSVEADQDKCEITGKPSTLLEEVSVVVLRGTNEILEKSIIVSPVGLQRVVDGVERALRPVQPKPRKPK